MDQKFRLSEYRCAITVHYTILVSKLVPCSTYWKKQLEQFNHLNGSATIPVIQLFISSKLGNITPFQMGQKFRLSKYRWAITVHYTILLSKLVSCSTYWKK